jgi:A/G-specific adenine glycosylase
MTTFADLIIHWHHQHGRHDLPWQQQPTPYRVWLSEIMLQQTQVATVIPYYQRFLQRFPTVSELATADLDQVLHLWTGLGYYARARNLHRAAQLIVEQHGAEFPRSVEALQQLPGIGRSTAGAIAALSMQIRAPILDGNVKRVLSRYLAIDGWPEQAQVKQQLWQSAEQLTPAQGVADYTQAIMDLGATVCTRSNPLCPSCPLQADCKALRQDDIHRYPGKKPKKTLPIKAITLFILQNEAGEVLLEKRPATGIWGSLYSLPEGKPDAEAPQMNQVQLSSQPAIRLQPLRHTFSHYHLDIQPVLLQASPVTSAVADSDRLLWYPLDHSMEVGLAAPVKKLLSALAQRN